MTSSVVVTMWEFDAVVQDAVIAAGVVRLGLVCVLAGDLSTRILYLGLVVVTRVNICSCACVPGGFSLKLSESFQS